jgi:hypothetical protein
VDDPERSLCFDGDLIWAVAYEVFVLLVVSLEVDDGHSSMHDTVDKSRLSLQENRRGMWREDRPSVSEWQSPY